MVTKSQLHHLKELNKVVLYFNYKRNVTEVKCLNASDGPDQQSTGDGVTGGTADSVVAELPLRPTRERRTPEYLNEYDIY